MKHQFNVTFLLLLTLSITSCKKIELTSCDIDVYHKERFSPSWGYVISHIKESAFYDKGWNLNFIEYKRDSEIDRTQSHVLVSSTLISDDFQRSTSTLRESRGLFHYTESSYNMFNEDYICNVKAKIYSPELSKTHTVELTRTMNTGTYEVSLGDYKKQQAISMCNKAKIAIVDKLPRCVLK
jgi:hypothetical protein